MALMKIRRGALAATVAGNALYPLLSQGALTLSAGVITDTVRAAGVEGDGGDIGDGVGVWPAATNIATQSIPGALATTGVTKAGDVAATLTKVADSTHPFPNATAEVWCLDNSAGSTDATVDFDGNATAAAHTASIWAYKTAGSPNLSIEGTSPTAISGATWARYTNTKTATAGDNLRITAPAGAVVYFVAAQLETGGIATPFILTDGGTASRVAGAVDIAVANILDETQSWVAMAGRRGLSSVLNAAYRGHFEWVDDTSNRISFYLASGDDPNCERYAAGVGAGSGGVPITYALGDTFVAVGAWTATAVKQSINGVAFTSGANSNIPTLSAASANIGQLNSFSLPQLTGDLFWFACGRGILTDADAALFNSWGSNRPLAHMFPQSVDISALAHFYSDGTQYRWSAA